MAPNQNPAPAALEPQVRPISGTEASWVRAAIGGTGITVCVVLLSKLPNPASLQNALHQILISHPILRSKLPSSSTTTTSATAFTIPPTPQLKLQTFQNHLSFDAASIPPLHQILEHELNQNPWANPDQDDSESGTDAFFSSLYRLPDSQWVVALRAHTSVCDRTTAVELLRELCGRVGQEGDWEGMGSEDGVNLGIEELIPSGKSNKPLWARGVDLIGYSLNSFRFCNLEFKDTLSDRSSGFVRLQLNPEDTQRLLSRCKARGIKLFGALAAAVVMAASSSKKLEDGGWEKYAVVTLIDCRSSLDPPLNRHNFGFYHSAVLNTHDVRRGSTELWELASRCYDSFTNAVKSNKQFTDINDMNFLMCKAIDNPALTPSSSLRTSLVAVFEDSVVEESCSQLVSPEMDLLDYVGCSSVHGVGPSIAIFDTIRDGALDCACVYPTPLHSREQMQELIQHMKTILSH